MFYKFYHQEPHRKFTHGPKAIYVEISDYIINNTREVWGSEMNVPFWKVRTNIKVNAHSCPNTVC